MKEAANLMKEFRGCHRMHFSVVKLGGSKMLSDYWNVNFFIVNDRTERVVNGTLMDC
jgi:hypothetical protein